MAEATATVVAADPAAELVALKTQFQEASAALEATKKTNAALEASLAKEKAATEAAIAEGQKQVAIAAKTGSKTGAQNNIVKSNPVLSWVESQYGIKAN